MAEASVALAHDMERQELIAATSGLESIPVWILGGTSDEVVPMASVEGAQDFFTAFKSDVSLIEEDLEHLHHSTKEIVAPMLQYLYKERP